MEELLVLIVEKVRLHRQLLRDVLQNELDQLEELVVEDLAVDEELSVVFLYLLADPLWNVLIDLTIVYLSHFLFLIGLILALNIIRDDDLSNRILELLFIY